MNKLLVLLTSLFLASCTSNPSIVSYESKGNLESTQPAECVSIEQLNSNQSPADIFVGLKKCLDSEKYSVAARMYYAAMTYGIYDTKRVSDNTSHQGLIVLRMNTLDGLSEQQLSLLQSEIDIILENNTEICEALADRGLPNYHPTYMIQHGIGAFTGNASDSGLIENFNGQAAWAYAIDKTVKCKKG